MCLRTPGNARTKGIKMKNETKHTPSKPSEKQYEVLRRRLLEETWGYLVKKCRGCGHPCIDGYVCQTCECDDP